MENRDALSVWQIPFDLRTNKTNGYVLAYDSSSDSITFQAPGGGGGGSGTVTDVSIVTANGISGSVANSTTTPAITLNISALDATKIANGSVSNTEFQYLDGVTSAIQTQLNAKQALDSDLTDIAGLSPTNDDIIQRKAGAWTNRTLAQLKSDISLSGTNTGDQTSIVGITGTKSQFDTACTDGNFLYVGDITQYTDEMAQDAVGAMIDSSLNYVDGTPLLQRSALTGDVTASAGSNATTIANDAVTFAKMQNINTGKLLGRSTASTGDIEEISVGTGLSLSGGSLSATAAGGFTEGSVLFANASGDISEDNAYFFWDDGNAYLGLGTAAPEGILHCVSSGTQQVIYEYGNGTDGYSEHIFKWESNYFRWSFGATNPNYTDADITGNKFYIFQYRNAADVLIQEYPFLINDNMSITFNESYTFPLADGAANTYLKTNGSGALSWSTATATAVTIANEATDTTCFPLFVTSATGDLAVKSNTGLTYNSNTNNLGCTTFTGALSGNATTATTLATGRTIGGVTFDGSANIIPQTIESANEATDTTCFPLFITASGTQQLQPKNNTGLTYNSNTNNLGATTFTGALSGNATTATTLATARAIYGNNFDGSAALTQIIASTYGGTGNGFTKFTGPTTSEKTFTLPNASSTILTTNDTVTVAQGGTGQTSYTNGQLLIGNTTGNTLTKATLTAGEAIAVTNGGGSITIDSLGYSLQVFGTTQFSPADATTYYFAGTPATAPSTTADRTRLYIPKTGTIHACYLTFWNSGTLGSAETSTISIRKNNTTDTTISSSVVNNAVMTAFNGTNLNIAVSAGDYIEIKWVCPTWTTNPTNVRVWGTLYIK